MKTAMNIVLATGVPQLDEALMQRIKSVNFVGSALYKEGVIDVVERKKPDVIILSEVLEGASLSIRELILTLRTRYPDTRIIYIAKEDNANEMLFLFQWSVFDILSGKFTVGELEEALRNPKEFKHVVGIIEELKKYQKNSDIIEPEMGDFKFTAGGQGFDAPEAGTDALYQQLVAFWSVRDQAGKTFSAVNTALMLARRPELKILLLDFSTDNPNVHLQLKFYDMDRNLGAIIQDIEYGDKITKDTLEQYLVPHPKYKNLMILPGLILMKMKDRPYEVIYKVFEQIINAAKQLNFSTVLVDTNSGLKDPLTINILKEKATKILLHVPEDPGSFMAVRKCFDTETGAFVSNLIDRKKVSLIITKAHEDKTFEFKKNLQSYLEMPVGSIMDYSDDVRQSLYAGVPLLMDKHSDEFYNSIILISNLIHKNVFRRPAKKNAGKKSNGTGLFGGLFKGKGGSTPSAKGTSKPKKDTSKPKGGSSKPKKSAFPSLFGKKK